jgi:hypothetical protein
MMKSMSLRTAAAAAALSGALAAFSATAVASNLVSNGSFENGNVNFSSDYIYSAPTPGTNGFPERNYTVGTNPRAWHNLFIDLANHTAGGSQMFIGNGSGNTSDRVWVQTITNAVVGQSYFFEAFAANVCCNPNGPQGAAVASLSFFANGQLLGTRTTSGLGVWQGLSTSWVADNTTVELRIMNSQNALQGNDFAIDDISFSTQTSVVPVPGALPLMLGGLGLIAWAARRRQS